MLSPDLLVALSLHDALPILVKLSPAVSTVLSKGVSVTKVAPSVVAAVLTLISNQMVGELLTLIVPEGPATEEYTCELQSRAGAVCLLVHEKLLPGATVPLTV